jgi:hypothetical protein
MDTPYRRFELLLPLRFNDGQAVPENLISETILELRERFGAVSCESQVTRGQWQHKAQVHRDDLMRVYVDVPNLPESREYFVALKERLKARFDQIDIWMTTYPLEII